MPSALTLKVAATSQDERAPSGSTTGDNARTMFKSPWPPRTDGARGREGKEEGDWAGARRPEDTVGDHDSRIVLRGNGMCLTRRDTRTVPDQRKDNEDSEDEGAGQNDAMHQDAVVVTTLEVDASEDDTRGWRTSTPSARAQRAAHPKKARRLDWREDEQREANEHEDGVRPPPRLSLKVDAGTREGEETVGVYEKAGREDDGGEAIEDGQREDGGGMYLEGSDPGPRRGTAGVGAGIERDRGAEAGGHARNEQGVKIGAGQAAGVGCGPRHAGETEFLEALRQVPTGPFVARMMRPFIIRLCATCFTARLGFDEEIVVVWGLLQCDCFTFLRYLLAAFNVAKIALVAPHINFANIQLASPVTAQTIHALSYLVTAFVSNIHPHHRMSSKHPITLALYPQVTWDLFIHATATCCLCASASWLSVAGRRLTSRLFTPTSPQRFEGHRRRIIHDAATVLPLTRGVYVDNTMAYTGDSADVGKRDVPSRSIVDVTLDTIATAFTITVARALMLFTVEAVTGWLCPRHPHPRPRLAPSPSPRPPSSPSPLRTPGRNAPARHQNARLAVLAICGKFCEGGMAGRQED
ncbi:hypothetical protein BD626DRAFT_574190 [Schizophyllum amplum]|uniref:Uncharacterized protein n=1 Tax=Schizophyllum amplum TaxID=97359 RepID=A0A550BYW0_9AGAR|nr:hypothetical protein BD626DRAFT_574190 [Auriculariopsis ampla]